MPLADVGLVGLGVMGSNLARNMARSGFSVALFDRHFERATQLAGAYPEAGFRATADVAAFVAAIKRPRKIILLITAGAPVDEVIKSIAPHLSSGDMVVDAGNSFYRDTERRCAELQAQKIHFVGMGVSGGSEGALYGPSLMWGGDNSAWRSFQKLCSAIAAKDFDGNPCVARFGNGGAGHYVKMVHNGIEYGLMQLIAETYGVLRDVYRLSPPQIAEIFARWNKGISRSYLLEISGNILKTKDNLSKDFLIDHILDVAHAHGTGAWTATDAFSREVGCMGIATAVGARNLSARHSERLALARAYASAPKIKPMPLARFTALAENALFSACLSMYVEGFELLRTATVAEKWGTDLAEVARVWQGGCIIRARVLHDIRHSLIGVGQKTSLLSAPRLRALLKKHLPDLRALVAYTATTGVSTPAYAAALFHLQDMATKRLPTNLIEGMRDYFGGHTFNRTDRSGSFHMDWQK